LAADTIYSVVVTAVANNGLTTSSDPLNCGTYAEPPGAVTGLASSSITSSEFTVSWSGGDGATYYTYAIDKIQVNPSVDNGLTSKSATFSGLAADTLYSIVITAAKSSSFGTLTTSSDPLSVTTAAAPAPTVKTITIVDLSGSTYLSGNTITLGNYYPPGQTTGNYTFTLANASGSVSWTNVLKDANNNTLTDLPGFTFSNSSSSEILDINIDQTATNMFYRQPGNSSTSFTVSITGTDGSGATGTCSLIFYIQDTS
jgi:hypothetical protein